MKRLLYAAGLFAVVASTQAFAQTQTLVAQIPFGFHLGHATMPAGEYRISEKQGILTLQADNGRDAAMSLLLPASRQTKASEPSLEFRKYGDEYFLNNIWDGQSRLGYTLPKSRREMELARLDRVGQSNTLVLATNAPPKNVK